MKKKKTTYALGFAVLVVWGLILYRVFHGVPDSDEKNFRTLPTQTKEVLNDYTIPPDTTPLKLNYRDPFGGESSPDTAHHPGNYLAISHTVKPLPPVPAKTDWGFIRYSGFVKNPGNRRLVAMVNIRGRDLMMSEGETVEEVRLIRNLQDSIKVMYKGQPKIIKINSTTTTKGL